MITLRLNPTLEKTVQKTADAFGITKSELVRESIMKYLETLKKPSAWELGADLFGQHASRDGLRSKNRKDLIRQKIQKKST
ncbi:MAG: CopG family transcriptional regulator [Candidatus Marinimicrobia bacterium]|nr:CopG family transcriptional regulator [Candidatus Neomarinimicrobiota bacterium]